MKSKKFISGLLAGAMVLTSLTTFGVSEVKAADEDSLVAYYTFEDGLANTVGEAGDEAVTVGKGITEYSSAPDYEAGRNGQAIRLNDNYGLKLNKENLGDSFTVSLWVKPDGALKENEVITFLGYNDPEQWVAFSGGTLRGGSSELCKFWANGNGYSTHTTLGETNVNTDWHKVTITGTEDTLTAYLDGVQIGSGATNHPLAQENGDIYIGVNFWQDMIFRGLVDDVKVYNTTATAEEVQKDYLRDIGDMEGFKVASYSFEDGLVNDEEAETDTASAVVTGLGSYNGEVAYAEDGFKGSAVRLGDYGLKLNKENLGENFSVSMWLNSDSTFPENQVLMFLGYHDPQKWIAVSGGEPGNGNSSLVKFWGKDDSVYTSHTTLSTTNIPAGSWHQLTVTGSEDTLTAYLDGEAIAYASGQNGASNHPLAGENQDIYIGVNYWDTEFEGLVDEIEVYDCTLSADYIAAAYAEATGDPKEGKIAEYTFEESIADNNGTAASAVVTGLGAYSGDVKYEAGFRGEAVRLGDYGLQLNKTNLGEDFTVSMWVKPDGTFAENQVLTLLGYHDPEQWLAVSGNRSGTSTCKFWANGGEYNTWTTLGTPAINADGWHQLVITGTESTVTAYLDGVQVGSGTSNHPLAQENGDIYLGVNNWDAEFSGLMDDVEIYGEALTAGEISQIYVEDLLAADAENLTVPAEVKWNMTLPAAGNSGQTTITWASSAENVINPETGEVTRPAQETGNAEVTLTATISDGSSQIVKEFTVTVLALNPDTDIDDYADQLTLNAGFVSSDISLPETVGEATVAWSSSDPAITVNGNTAAVTRADGANTEVTLTAVVSLEGTDRTVTKEFPLTVLAAGQDVVTYISSDPATGQDGGMKIAQEDGDGFAVLHSNQPILYSSQGTRSFGAAQIFRKADGSFGVVATDGTSSGNLVFFDSEDLISYSNEKLVSVPGVSGIQSVNCVYDSADEVYRIFVLDGNDNIWTAESSDLNTISSVEAGDYTFPTIEGAPEDALNPYTAALTQAEYDALVQKFATITNTGVEAPANVEINQGGEVTLPETVTAEYSDGSTKQLGVEWNADDLAEVDTSVPGDYTVRGTVQRTISYTDPEEPLVYERADPYIVYDSERDMYYFTGSYPTNGVGGADGYDRLVIRAASTIEGLSDASAESVIWDESWDDADGNSYSQWIWAPEIHKIGDYWYIISTAGTNGGDRFGTLRPFMMRCTDPDNITDPASWEDPVRVKPMAGDEKNCLNAMSLDMTYFEADGHSYLAWADFTQTGISSIYIAEIDPADPTQLISPCTVISAPEYSWEYVRAVVNEGPAVFKNNGKVYMAFSASGTGSEYCVGLLTANEGDDLLDADSWVKTNYPVLTSTDFNDEVSGPGHNSFTVDEYGNVIIVYHARPAEIHSSGGIHNGDPLQDPCRYAYLQPVNIAADGSPVLNMTPEQELADEYMNVSITIKVSASEVEKTLTGITVTGQPSKTEYEVGDKFDPSGIEVTATYSDGDTKVLGADAEGLTFSPEEFTEAGPQTVTVLYTVGNVTQTASVNVTVSEKAEAPAVLTGIEITTQPSKTEYEVGDAFDPEGMVVTASYDKEDPKEVALNKLTFTPEVFSEAGDQTVTVSYTENGVTKEAELQVTVTEKTVEPEVTLDSIKVTPPQTLEYKVGQDLDLTGMTVTAVYSDGSEKDVTADAVLSGFNKDEEGVQTIQVSYTESDVTVTATFKVTVASAETEEPENPDAENPSTEKPNTEKPENPDTEKPGSGPSASDQPGAGTSTPSGDKDGTDGGSAVQTGDTTNILPTAAVAVFALAGAAAVVVLKKRKRG